MAGRGAVADERGRAEAPSALPGAKSKPVPAAVHRIPDYLLSLEADGRSLPEAFENTLQSIAKATKSDSRLLVRIDGYVPDEASPELSLGIADKALQKVKERLLGMGVAARRIMLQSKGEMHDKRNFHATPWLEVFLMHP